MSRTRDLRPFRSQTPPNPPPGEPLNRSPHSFRSPNASLLPDDYRPGSADRSPSATAPPMRPQRSAARQPGIVVSNGSEPALHNSRRYPSPAPSHASSSNERYQDIRAEPPNRQASLGVQYGSAPDRDHSGPTGSSNKLYQAISGRPNVRRDSPSARNQQPNGAAYLDQDYRGRDEARGHKPQPSTSSTGSFDYDAHGDLLSANELKDAKRMHGARNVLAAFTSQVGRQSDRQHAKASINSGNLDPRIRSPPGQNPDPNAQPSMLDDQSYPLTPGFREIERVLQKIKLGWEPTGITGGQEDDGFGGSPPGSASQFSPVGLALDLLENDNPEQANSGKRARDMINQKGTNTPSLASFLMLKAELEKALQLTIQGNYRQFDASVNSYNLAKANVDSSCKKVTELKAKLVACRATLGNGSPVTSLDAPQGGKGTEMKVIQARRDGLREMLKLLDTIDQLKQVPERLESSISAKSFLSATVLLVRSLKVINKPELAEIGGLSDLRAYLVNQESVVFEILIEELHNHLYLKSYFCDHRWSVYRKGQVSLPVVHHLDEPSSEFSLDTGSKSNQHPTPWDVPRQRHSQMGAESGAKPQVSASRLQQYLTDLLTKPQSNPLVDEADVFLRLSSFSPYTDPDDANTHQISRLSSSMSGKKPKSTTMNPELDSFKYIESLIESLAVLGKLSLGLDAILQRVPVEVYALVDSTLSEVDERHESTKGTFSTAASSKPSIKKSLNMINLLISTAQMPTSGTSPQTELTRSQSSRQVSGFKINTNELKELEATAEILQDFFWTLYSKLDATLQSFRVLHEVSLRISERRSFKEEGMKPNHMLFSLLEVWKPIQSELLALIHAYLTESDSHQFSGADGMTVTVAAPKSGGAASRNPMASIAEVLKINLSGGTGGTSGHTSWKANNKQLFTFKDGGQKLSSKELKAHEHKLDAALKMSVPGLVLDSKAAHTNLGVGLWLTAGLMSGDEGGGGRGAGRGGNGTHRLLVKPDAFHIALLLRPTLEFLKRAREVLPSGLVIGSNEPGIAEEEPGGTMRKQHVWDDDGAGKVSHFGGFSGFLDEFVLHTFLPQLEERVICMFEHSINAPDAFQDDVAAQLLAGNLNGGSALSLRLKKVWRPPVAKSLTAVMSLIERLSEMLQSTPFHQEKYGRLIVSVVVQYYQKCHERFKEMVVRESSEAGPMMDAADSHLSLKLAAEWAQKQELVQCLQSLRESSAGEVGWKKLGKQRRRLEQKYFGTHTLVVEDLILSAKKVAGLAHLYSTLECFVGFIRRLGSTVRAVPHPEGEEGLGVESLDSELAAEVGFPAAAGAGMPRPTYSIPLTYAVVRRFQLSQRSYATLAQTILFTLHLELRLMAYHYVEAAFREGRYSLGPSDSTDPDEQIILLNSALAGCAGALASGLRARERTFVGAGLESLLDGLLVEGVVRLRAANEAGCRKMVRNVVALQQNLKALSGVEQAAESDGKAFLEFEPSRTFWQMGALGPQAVMESVRGGARYTFEQYKHLLGLLCTSEPVGDSRLSLPSTADELARLSVGTWLAGQAQGSKGAGGGGANAVGERKKRMLNEFLIELHALVLEDDDDDDD